jgi:hypothetical protein
MAPSTHEQTRRDTPITAHSGTGSDSHQIPAQGADAFPDNSDPRWVTAIRRIFHVRMLQPAGMELPFEERRKRRLFSALVVPGIIILLVVGLFHLFSGNLLEGWLHVSGGLWLLSSILWLRIAIKGLPIYRINTILLGLLFLFLSAKGGIQGNKLLWMFSFPLIALYTLGIPEGLFWIAAVWLLNMAVLFLPLDSPWIHTYSLDFKIRFCVAYFLVVSMACI